MQETIASTVNHLLLPVKQTGDMNKLQKQTKQEQELEHL
jgi:hypothetical protein